MVVVMVMVMVMVVVVVIMPITDEENLNEHMWFARDRYECQWSA